MAINILAFFTIVGVHTGISLTSGGYLLFPYFLAAVFSALIIWTNRDSVNNKTLTSMVVLLLLIVVNSAINSVIFNNAIENIRSILVLCVSCVIGYAIYIHITVIGRRRASGFYFFLLIVVTIGSLVELYTPLSDVSDSFRSFFGDWRGVYSSDYRDIESYGGVRPKFFASEPSILATTIGISFLVWYASTSRRLIERVLITVIMVGLSVYLVRSAVILIFALSAIILRASYSAAGVSRTIISAIVVVGVLALIAAVSVFAIINFEERLVDVYQFNSGSFFLRQVGPPLLAAEVFLARPLVGFGMGNSAELNEFIINVYSSVGFFDRFSYMQAAGLGSKNLITNTFFDVFIYFGSYSVVYMFGLSRLFKSCGIDETGAALACTFLLYFSVAGFNTPNTWVVNFAVAAVVASLVNQRGVDGGVVQNAPSPSFGGRQFRIRQRPVRRGYRAGAYRY